MALRCVGIPLFIFNDIHTECGFIRPVTPEQVVASLPGQ